MLKDEYGNNLYGREDLADLLGRTKAHITWLTQDLNLEPKEIWISMNGGKNKVKRYYWTEEQMLIMQSNLKERHTGRPPLTAPKPKKKEELEVESLYVDRKPKKAAVKPKNKKSRFDIVPGTKTRASLWKLACWNGAFWQIRACSLPVEDAVDIMESMETLGIETHLSYNIRPKAPLRADDDIFHL